MKSSPRTFVKPPQTAQQLIELLTTRGLVISDRAECERALRKIGYYRLSAYMLPLQIGGPAENRHDFHPGANFKDVLDLYVFDRKLRLLVLDAMEPVEVAFRAAITDNLAVMHGPHWYMAPEFFEPPFNHAGYLDDTRYEIGHSDERRRTVSISHYYARYDHPEMPPSWMVFEALPFGKIAHTIRRLRKAERARIGRSLGLPEPVLESWCLSLNYLRNSAAHHARLWNRTFTIKPLRSNQYADDLARNETCYAQLVTLQVILKSISPGSEWPQRLSDLFEAHPKVMPRRLGFPDNWQGRPLWGVLRTAPPAPEDDGAHHTQVPRGPPIPKADSGVSASQRCAAGGQAFLKSESGDPRFEAGFTIGGQQP